MDDLIELKGRGMIGLWRFPKNVTGCPSNGCHAQFKTRSAILAHYRAVHAPVNILCPACNKPVQAKHASSVVQHFRYAHKHMDIPAEFDVTNDNEADDDDDVIQLNGCGQVTFFRFPQNTTCCPAYNCSVDSGFRSRAIAHYKRMHAKDHIFCTLCQKPVGAKWRHTLLKHYNTIHPNIDLPEFLKKQEDEVSLIAFCDVHVRFS